MIYGYARVSRLDQNLQLQIDALLNYGVDELITEKMSGYKRRPELESLLSRLKPRDKIVVWKLDRLGRSVQSLLQISKQLEKTQVDLVITTGNIDTGTAAGKMFFTMLCVFAEYERNVIAERTKAGIDAARKKGRVGGRPTIAASKQAEIVALYDEGLSYRSIVEKAGVSIATVFRYINLEKERRLKRMSGEKEKMEEIQKSLETLQENVKDIMNSEQYKTFLNFMSTFHSYSFQNRCLIYRQNPNASLVAGFAAWKTKGRYVKRGEKAIAIIGGRERKKQITTDLLDQNGAPVLDENGRRKQQKEIIRYMHYFPAYVFDVSQTDGDPIPQQTAPVMLSGDYRGYDSVMQALKDISPYPFLMAADLNGANGRCNFTDREIHLLEGMSQAQTIKTAIHEVSHAIFHAQDVDTPINQRTDRETREMEAESLAYIVSNHLGLDTSDYSFPYVAAWASSKSTENVMNILSSTCSKASVLIDQIDQSIYLSHVQELRQSEAYQTIQVKAVSGNNMTQQCVLTTDFSPERFGVQMPTAQVCVKVNQSSNELNSSVLVVDTVDGKNTVIKEIPSLPLTPQEKELYLLKAQDTLQTVSPRRSLAERVKSASSRVQQHPEQLSHTKNQSQSLNI